MRCWLATDGWGAWWLKLEQKGHPLLIIEDRQEIVDQLRARGLEAISGNAAQAGVLKAET